MTISKKQRMLGLIEKIETGDNEQLSLEVKAKLHQAKKSLQQLTETQVEQLTDHVFSISAPKQELDFNSPKNLLHSCYDELNAITQNEHAPSQLQAAVREMRYFFSITEQDGFFP